MVKVPIDVSIKESGIEMWTILLCGNAIVRDRRQKQREKWTKFDIGNYWRHYTSKFYNKFPIFVERVSWNNATNMHMDAVNYKRNGKVPVKTFYSQYDNAT